MAGQQAVKQNRKFLHDGVTNMYTKQEICTWRGNNHLKKKRKKYVAGQQPFSRGICRRFFHHFLLILSAVPPFTNKKIIYKKTNREMLCAIIKASEVLKTSKKTKAPICFLLQISNMGKAVKMVTPYTSEQ